jgi:hypothetical protein
LIQILSLGGQKSTIVPKAAGSMNLPASISGGSIALRAFH